jgi:ABC-type multidrug transport system ATPase subunit
VRIASISIEDEANGLSKFSMDGLNRFVILAGENGSGKTRLLKLIENTIKWSESHKNNSVSISYCNDEGNLVTDGSKPNIRNYSHSDLPLQSVKDFSPYIINKSKENLAEDECTFEQTAREALLYLTWLVRYASEEELKRFNIEYCQPILKCSLETDGEEKNPLLFKHPISELSKMPISPGQKYLLRLCIALNCNDIPDGAILFLDEPESHLHPKVLLDLFKKLEDKFNIGQVWIATHSIELMSHFDYDDIWHMENGIAKKMGSKSGDILGGILGDEKKRNDMYQFIASNDAFACNVFAVECLINPKVIADGKKNDPGIELTRKIIKENDIIMDFGAGKGRFIESYYSQNNVKKINYYAYDKYGYLMNESIRKCSAEWCKEVMKKYCIPVENYIENGAGLRKFTENVKADIVLLINVLHEISPRQWQETFHIIHELLKKSGELVIVERKELTYGEKPFDSDFFVIQQESLCKLLKCEIGDFDYKPDDYKKKVFGYKIPKYLLNNITEDTVNDAILETEKFARKKIKELKDARPPEGFLWEYGVALAFWTHQFANARLYIDTS